MRIFITLLLLMASVTVAQAQQQDADCLKKTTLIDSLVNSGNLRMAFEPWSDVRKTCKSVPESFYTNGEQILKYSIDNAAEKEPVVRDLLQLYDEHDKKFPSNTSGNSLKKAVVSHQYGLVTAEEAYSLFDIAFNGKPQTFTDPTALHLYFDLYYKKYKSDAKPTDVFAKRDAIEAHINSISRNATEINRKGYERAITSIDALIADVATCENLLGYYENEFQNHVTDTIWLARTANRLVERNCLASPLFLKIATASNKINPTSKSAKNLGTAALNAGERDLAANYYATAAELSTSFHVKSEMYYTIASTVYGISNKAKAKEFATKALAVNPKMGKAYMFLAQMYANSGAECGETPFERKAIYWLAADMARKAGEVDENLKRTGSDRVVEKYLKLAPSESEMKAEKKLGKTITFKCWINESVKIPKS